MLLTNLCLSVMSLGLVGELDRAPNAWQPVEPAAMGSLMGSRDPWGAEERDGSDHEGDARQHALQVQALLWPRCAGVSKDLGGRQGKRRGAGEGSIYRRTDGRWAAAFTVGVDPNGKRHRKTVYGATQQEVLEKLREARRQSDSGLLPERASTLTVAEYLDYWLAEFVARESRPSTVRIYRQAANRARPFLGGREVQDVRRPHVEGLLRRLGTSPRGEIAEQVLGARDLTHDERGRRLRKALGDKRAQQPLSRSTLSTVRNVLQLAFGQALREGIVALNPANGAALPKGGAAQEVRSYPDPAALARFLEAAQADDYAAFWTLAVHSGARHGELLALRWKRVDFEGSAIRVAETWDEGSKTAGPPKSKAGERWVPLGPEPMEALRRHRAALGAVPHPEHFVFASDETGRPVHPTTIRAHMKAILNRAGLPPTTRVHDLRHGASSVLANSNAVALTVARDRLGHSSVRMTERYVHPDAESQRRAAETLSAALNGRLSR